MLFINESPYEFRGMESKVSSTGSKYALIHLEDDNGKATDYCCRNLDCLDGFVKGDQVLCYFSTHKYNGNLSISIEDMKIWN